METCVLEVGIPNDAADAVPSKDFESLKFTSDTAIQTLSSRCRDIVERISRLRASRSFQDLLSLCLETRLDGMACYDALLFALPDQRILTMTLVGQLSRFLSEAGELSGEVALEMKSKDIEKPLNRDVAPPVTEHDECRSALFYARNVEFRSKLIAALAEGRYDDFFQLLKSATGFTSATTAEKLSLERIVNPVQRGFVYRLASGLLARIEYIAAEAEMEHGPYPDCLEIHRQMAEFAVSQFEKAMCHGLVPASYQDWIRKILKSVTEDVIAKLDPTHFADSNTPIRRINLDSEAFSEEHSQQSSKLSDILRLPLQTIRLRVVQLVQQTAADSEIRGRILDPHDGDDSGKSMVLNFPPESESTVHQVPLQILIYRSSDHEQSEWCATCLDYRISAWDINPAEALLKLCDKIEVEESFRKNGIRVNGFSAEGDRPVVDITPDQMAAPETAPDELTQLFATDDSEEFDLSSIDPSLQAFVQNCSLRGLKVRKTDQLSAVDC